MYAFVGQRGAGSSGGRGHWTVFRKQLHSIQVTRGKKKKPNGFYIVEGM